MTGELATMVHAAPASRPRVICHMLASIDGRIVIDAWALSPAARGEYERVAATFGADGWLCGRVTMEEGFAAGVRADDAVADVYSGAPREDFVAADGHRSFAIAADPRGRLRWRSADLGGDHLVVLLCETVSDAHLRELRAQGISYLLAGHDELDLSLALQKLTQRFQVRTLLLEGGGAINGACLAADLVDAISLLVAPVVDTRPARPSLFDVVAQVAHPRRLSLDAVEQRADGVVWLQYTIVRQT